MSVLSDISTYLTGKLNAIISKLNTITTALAGKADDAAVVHKTGNLAESIGGVKTFTSQINTSSHGNSSQWNTAYNRGDFRDYGIGAVKVSTEVDFDQYLTPGTFVTPSSGLLHSPAGIQTRFIVTVSGGINAYASHIAVASNTGAIYYRHANVNTFTPWKRLWSDSDFSQTNINTWNSLVSNATHTGDVTGDTVLTIANNAVTTPKIINAAVTNAKLAAAGNNTLKGNASGITTSPQDLTPTQVKSMLNLDQVDNTADINKPVSNGQQLALDLKADKSTTYTKTEVTSLLSGKSNTGHTHSQSDITNLITDLGQLDSDINAVSSSLCRLIIDGVAAGTLSEISVDQTAQEITFNGTTGSFTLPY